MPSPHTSFPTSQAHLEILHAVPLPSSKQRHPASTVQVALHPSPFVGLLSSHISEPARFPSPHDIAEQVLGSSAEQLYPHSTRQEESHPSPLAVLLSSQDSSPPATSPSPHSAEQRSDVAPIALKCLPYWQFVHSPDPLIALYVPKAQNVHGPPSCPVDPALQVQSAIVMLPNAELACAGQLSQPPDPVAFLYLPATHAAHRPSSGPEWPALQAQSAIAMLAIGEME